MFSGGTVIADASIYLAVMITNFIKPGSYQSWLALACLILLFMPAGPEIVAQESAVREAQALLTDLDYLPGPVDGILGPQTLRALRDFQRTNGLALTENIDLRTLRLLQAAGGKSHVRSAGLNTVSPSRASPLDRGFEITSTSDSAAPLAVTDVSVAYTARSSEPEVSVRVGQAVGLFVLTVITATLVLGLLGFLGVIHPTIERVWPFMSRRACSFLTDQAAICRKRLREIPFWDGLNRSFLGRTIVTHFHTIGSSKTLKSAKRHLQFLASGDHKSRFWQGVKESLRYGQGTPASSDLGSHRNATPLGDTSPRSRKSEATCDQSANERAEQALYATIIKSSDAPLPTVQESSHRKEIDVLTITQDTPLRRRGLIGDPLASLSVHLAFERFDEAEELAKNAVEQYPERHEYRLRLLQVYHAVGNRVGFEYHAKALSAAVGSSSPMMAMVAEWWRDLAPNEELFSTPETQISSKDEPNQQGLEDDQEAPVIRQ